MQNLNEMKLDELNKRFGISITGNLITRKSDKNISKLAIAFPKLANLNLLGKDYENDVDKSMDFNKYTLETLRDVLKDIHQVNLGTFTFKQIALTAEFIQKYSKIYPVNIILGHIFNVVNKKASEAKDDDYKAVFNAMKEEDSVILLEAQDLDVQTQIDYANGDKIIRSIIDNHLSPIKLTKNDSNHTYIATMSGRTYRRFYKGDYEICSEILLLFLFYKILYSNMPIDLSEIPVIRNIGKEYEIYLPITNINVTGYNLKDEKNKPEMVGFTTLQLANKYYSFIDMINSDINNFLLFYTIGFPIFDDIDDFKSTMEKLITKDYIYIDLFIDFYNQLKEEAKGEKKW